MPELASPSRTHGLVDVLDRVLDKGLVIAGDIKINLANVELLTVQVRLLVCSIDKAEQIGLNWWRSDPRLTLPATARPGDALVSVDMEQRLARLEHQLEQLIARSGSPAIAGADAAAASVPRPAAPGGTSQETRAQQAGTSPHPPRPQGRP